MARLRLLLLCLLLLPTGGLSAQVAPTEYDVKAAFLYNFARFAQWPQEVDSGTLRICLLGDAPFGPAFDDIVGQTVRQKRIEVQTIGSVSSTDSCHVLFVTPAINKQRWRKIFTTVATRPILTVGDGEDFVRAGGMIGFVIRGKKVRFLVNPAAAEAAGIRLSSRLLRVAEIYGTED
ncbi:MAG: YfiR family protein [Gemmatimonadetes bacterium]|nr:YfiR family protein [Gemmatimonadota bacterium]MBT6146195.1 YfiR family protein [Gemmatimonadota bacterium]MBT7863946.1 YfiR family protein [Gemmatimonadota bacterium]